MPRHLGIGRPGGDLRDSPREQVHIETERGGALIDALFLWRQEVKEQRAETSSADDLGHVLIPWAVPTAAAAVRKEHQAARLGRKVYVPVQRCFACGDVDAVHPLRLRGWIPFTHGLFLLRRASALWASAAWGRRSEVVRQPRQRGAACSHIVSYQGFRKAPALRIQLENSMECAVLDQPAAHLEVSSQEIGMKVGKKH